MSNIMIKVKQKANKHWIMLDRLKSFSLCSSQAYIESLLSCINLCNKCHKKSWLWNLLGAFRQNHIWNKQVRESIIVWKTKRKGFYTFPQQLFYYAQLYCQVICHSLTVVSFYCKLRQVLAFSFVLNLGLH